MAEKRHPYYYSLSLYNRWKSMRQRCINPSCQAYPHYGARGITICEDWGSYPNFRDWAIQAGFDESLSLDRIDPDGNYCPENCRWTTAYIQAHNRHGTHAYRLARALGVDVTEILQEVPR